MLCETMNQIGPSLSRLRWLIFLTDFFNWKQETLEISNLWSPDKLYIQSASKRAVTTGGSQKGVALLKVGY